MWTMEKPAIYVAERMTDEAHRLPPEVMRLDDATAAIVIEVDGGQHGGARLPAAPHSCA